MSPFGVLASSAPPRAAPSYVRCSCSNLASACRPCVCFLCGCGEVDVNRAPVARVPEDVVVADDPVPGLRVPPVAFEVAEALGVRRELVAVDGLARVVDRVDELAGQVEVLDGDVEVSGEGPLPGARHDVDQPVERVPVGRLPEGEPILRREARQVVADPRGIRGALARREADLRPLRRMTRSTSRRDARPPGRTLRSACRR